MRRKLPTIYAAFCTLCLAAGILLTFYFAYGAGLGDTIECLCALVASFVLAPIVHETGHIVMACATNMRVVFVKFFCFKIDARTGKKRFGFASPFAPDQTQAVPRVGGNMRRRATRYTLGGQIFSGAFLLLVTGAALTTTLLHATRFSVWGLLPYAAYLFLLNALPVEYGGGKTDVLVYRGLKKGYDAEKTMLAAMEIQGRLSEGKSFTEIDEAFYFDLPQLPEDEPLFAVMLDLRYRYYLEKREWEKAADALNRLASAQAYLPDEEVEKVAAELVYMHSVNGDFERAEESGKYCKAFLQGESPLAKRALAAYSAAFGKADLAAALIEQAETVLEREPMAGIAKAERILLARLGIKTRKEANSKEEV